MDTKSLQCAVSTDTKEVLKPITDIAYSLKQPSSYEMALVAQDVNKNLGFNLIQDIYSHRLLLDFSRVARAVQTNAVAPNASEHYNLLDLINAQMEEGVKAQDRMYDEIVLTAMENPDKTAASKAYDTYLQKINHFDIRAFRKIINIITTDIKTNEPELFEYYCDQFSSISEYSNARNNWDKKLHEINETEGTPLEKQAMWESLDKRRTRAHNKMINLFNSLNKLALEKGVAKPYPYFNSEVPIGRNPEEANQYDFDPLSPIDREKAAHIMLTQETLLETVHLAIIEYRDPTKETKKERYSKMSIGEMYKEAMENTNQTTMNLEI